MRAADYNLGIPKLIVNRSARAPLAQLAALLSCLLLLVISAQADWSEPEQQLARKIVAVTGPGTMAVTFENRSSLGKRDSDIVQNGIRSALEQVGIRFTGAEQGVASVTISLSENSSSYVWVAQIRQGTNDPAVVMVSVARPAGTSAGRESVPLSLRKTSLWMQDTPIVDVLVLDDNGTPTHMAVLDPEKVTLYRWQGIWQQEQALAIVHARPWPRDVRGRILAARDHLFDVYLPGVTCRSSSAAQVSLVCRESDDPWPLVPAGMGSENFGGTAGASGGAIPPLQGFYAANRNFFTGALTPGIGKMRVVPKFYSAALLPRDKYLLWLLAATDGHVHLIDGMNDQLARFDWGSDLASVKTACGAGWQVLATSSDAEGREQNGDSIRAYEFPDRDPIAVSPALEISGAISALWTESRGDTAIAVVKNRDKGNYEAFRLAVVCNQ